jgi:hypothetical protein
MTAARPTPKLVHARAIALFLGLNAVSASAATSGCVLDWTLREPVDASAPADSAGDVATADAPSDTQAPDAPSCTTLLADAQSARAQARSCTLGVGDCAAKVKDECGCDVFVARAGTTATTRYQSAVAAAVAAGCTTACTSCPFVPAVGTCLQSPSGIACSP